MRVPSKRFNGSYLDSAAQIRALLDAAGEMDRSGQRSRGHGRALLATLTFAGLRIDEALSLRWAQVDLAAGRLRVGGTKTAAASRVVSLLPALRNELDALKARRDPERTELVFGTSNGRKDSQSNVRRRLLAPAVKRANERLAQADGFELPERLTPHSLRRTHASLLVALGRNPQFVMDQLGHTDPALTLRVYAKEIEEADREQLRALVGEGAAAAVPDTPITAVEAA